MDSDFKIAAALEAPAVPVDLACLGSTFAGGGGVHASVTLAMAFSRLAEYFFPAANILFSSNFSMR